MPRLKLVSPSLLPHRPASPDGPDPQVVTVLVRTRARATECRCGPIFRVRVLLFCFRGSSHRRVDVAGLSRARVDRRSHGHLDLADATFAHSDSCTLSTFKMASWQSRAAFLESARHPYNRLVRNNIEELSCQLPGPLCFTAKGSTDSFTPMS